MKVKGGLLLFNTFLSTSRDRLASLVFAESNQEGFDTIGVLFEININPSVSSTPFANVGNINNYQADGEILSYIC